MIPENKITDKNLTEQADRSETRLEFEDPEASALRFFIKIRLVWGWLLLLATAALIATLQVACYQLIPWLGVTLVAVGFALSIRVWNQNRDLAAHHVFKALIWNWAGCFSGLGIILFGVYTKTFYPLFIPPIIATGMGLNCWNCGAFFEKRLQSCLALSWWCGALVMWIVGTDYTLLFFGLLLIGLELVPDWLLLRPHEHRRCDIGNRQ